MPACPVRKIWGQRVKTGRVCITYTEERLPHRILQSSILKNGYYGDLCGAGYWKVRKDKMWPPNLCDITTEQRASTGIIPNDYQ